MKKTMFANLKAEIKKHPEIAEKSARIRERIKEKGLTFKFKKEE